MSILDVFYVLYKGDTSDLEKAQKKSDKLQDDGAGKAKQRSREKQKDDQASLKNAEGMNSALKNVQDTAQGASLSFLDMAADAAAALGVAFSLGAAVHSVFGTEQNVLNLGRFSKALGLNTGQVYQWGRAVKDVAGEGADITADIKTLSDNLNRSTVIGGGIIQMPINEFTQGLQNNGIELLNNSRQIKSWADIFVAESQRVDELRSKGLNDAQINAFLRNQLHLSEGTAMFLQQGSMAVKQQLATVLARGVPTQQDVDRVYQFAKSWGTLKQNIEELGMAFAGPVLDFLNDFPDKIERNKQQFDDFVLVIKIGGAILAAALVPFVTELVIAQAPLIIFTALLGTLYLAIEKLGASKIEGWFSGFGSSVDWLTTKIGKLGALMVTISDNTLSLKDKGAQLKSIWSDPEFDIDRGPKTEKEHYGPHRGGLEKTGDKRSEYKPSTDEMLAAAKATIDMAARNPISAQTSGSMVNRASQQMNSVHIDNIEVVTQATDADQVASGIGDALHKHVNVAISNFDNGILA